MKDILLWWMQYTGSTLLAFGLASAILHPLKPYLWRWLKR